MRRPTADLLLFTTVLLWAFNFTVSKYILEHGFHPLAYSSLRYASAAAVFAVITLPREGSLLLGRRDLPVAAGAVALLFANQLCFIYALDFTTATTVALLFGTLPVFTALIARVTGLERLTLRFWLAALLSFGGVALVAIGSGGDLSSDLGGDLLAVGGAATWAAYSVAIAPLMRRYSPFRISGIFLLAVTVPLFAVGTPQLADQTFDLGWLVWLGFAFSVVGPLVVTNLTWFTAIDRVGAARASVFANLQFFLAALIALILLSENLTRLEIAGGLAIAAGILLSRTRVAAAVERPLAE